MIIPWMERWLGRLELRVPQPLAWYANATSGRDVPSLATCRLPQWSTRDSSHGRRIRSKSPGPLTSQFQTIPNRHTGRAAGPEEVYRSGIANKPIPNNNISKIKFILFTFLGFRTKSLQDPNSTATMSVCQIIVAHFLNKVQT